MLLLTLLQLPEDLGLTDLAATQKIVVKLGLRLFIDLFSIGILIRGLYYKTYQKKDLFFTYFTFNLVIFLICFLLNKVDLSMGAAFGLFAVFSMLRYKTEEISLKDMTYLFLVIAIGLISAVAKIKGASDIYEYTFLIGINALILAFSYTIEFQSNHQHELSQTITYDKLEYIKKENKSLLIEDIKNRTGINIQRLVIGKIDLSKNAVQIKVYYFEDDAKA